MNTLKEFRKQHDITAAVKEAASNPNMEDWTEGVNHWTVTFEKADGSTMAVPFSTGPGLKGIPTPEDVLDCLASDAATITEVSNFDEWCDELGYDTDSRKAYKTWEAVDDQTQELRLFLGEAEFNQLLWDTERL